MSTRGVKNSDVGKYQVGLIADVLEGKAFDGLTAAQRQRDFDLALGEVIGWLRAIESGADPAETMFKGKHYENDRHSRTIAGLIQIRINSGISQGQAIREVAKTQELSLETVKSTFKRWRHRINKEDPLGLQKGVQ